MTEDYECPFCGDRFLIGDDWCCLRDYCKHKGEPFMYHCYVCGNDFDLNKIGTHIC